ncbi:MAG: cation transporter [Deltaproteobacteria bacterium]|nr:cation transporter [Deltaproteobacteria bacterium]
MALDAKGRVAWVSLAAAAVLTSAKLIAGLATDSIGVLSEALHSALDLVAAVMTVFAISRSGRPADADHQFGHGKYENLSALFETLLLVATCAWIVWEAVERLEEGRAPESSPWAFAVMLLSIAVDVQRSRALMRVAREYGSQALEADALHFSSDVISSCAVIAGLALSAAGLGWADPLAALAVAGVVLVAAVRLIGRSVDALLDRAPAGAREAVRTRIGSVEGVIGEAEVRVRPQGPVLHVDAVVHVDGRSTLDEAHAVASRVEDAVRESFPGADVNVHVEPRRGCDPGGGS